MTTQTEKQIQGATAITFGLGALMGVALPTIMQSNKYAKGAIGIMSIVIIIGGIIRFKTADE